ncbi:MAG: hypothetical protein ACK2UA_12470, partial [Anaerolineae bacterium]
MTVNNETMSAKVKSVRLLWNRVRAQFSQVPLLGWLLGALVAVILELIVGTPLARALGMSKVPVLFGAVI